MYFVIYLGNNMEAVGNKSIVEYFVYNNTVRLVAVTILAFLVVNGLRLLTQALQERWGNERKLKDFEKLKLNPRHWLFGHTSMLDPTKAVDKFAQEATKAVTGVAKVWLGPFKCYLAVLSPESIKTILSTAEPKDGYGYGFVKPWVGDGLLISGGKKWHRNRKLLTPAFHFEVLKPYTKLFNDSALTIVKKWKLTCEGKERYREMFKDISLLTLDSLLKCIFSIESNCQTERVNHPYIKSVYEISELIMERVTNIFHHNDVIYHLTPTGWRWRRAVRAAHAFTNGVIADRKQEERDIADGLKQPTRKYVDFLDILIGARDEEGNGLTDREIKDEVDTFMFEGHDTTASGTSWMLYNMARHPEYQQKCRDEVDQLFMHKEEDRIDWDDLHKLPYLTMCLKESLRLHSPVPIINRELERPLTFTDGQTAPPGTNITIQLGSMHIDENVWKDPARFIPERFSPENSRGRPSHAYVPFSAGPRNCIGQNFAMNEMKVMIAMILRHFHLRVDETVPVEKFFSVVLRAKDGIHLHIKPREL